MVLRRIIDFGLQARKTAAATRTVTGSAHVIALTQKSGRMGRMTIATGNAGIMHLALLKGAIDKYLIQTLAIGLVKALVQLRRYVVIEQTRLGHESLCHLTAPAMT